jgi:hypothetical protein
MTMPKIDNILSILSVTAQALTGLFLEVLPTKLI